MASHSAVIQKGINNKKAISEDLTELAEKQEKLRASMVARFSASEARISSSQSTLEFLKSQIEVWNSQRN
mgnify:CR=1 FL=1